MSDSFASAQDLAQRQGAEPPADLARMQSFLEDASALIRAFCGQTLSTVAADTYIVQPQISATTGQTFPLPAAYGEIIFLPQRPVTAVSSVVTGGVAFTSFSFTGAGLLYRTDGLAWTKSTTVTYDHGYAESSEEYKEIRAVCLNIVQRALFGPQGEVFGPERVEAVGWSAELYLTEQDKMRLRHFGGMLVG